MYQHTSIEAAAILVSILPFDGYEFASMLTINDSMFE